MSTYSTSPPSASAVEHSIVRKPRAANARCSDAVSVEKNGWRIVGTMTPISDVRPLYRLRASSLGM